MTAPRQQTPEGSRRCSPGFMRCLAVTGALLLSWLLPQAASASLSWSGPIALAPSDALGHVACPSVSQCTVGGGSSVWTFDPASPASVSQTELEDSDVGSLACPAVNQCTAIGVFETPLGEAGEEWTFDPASPEVSTGVGLSEDGLAALRNAVACPSVSQCTIVGVVGEELTFDPQAPGAPQELHSTDIDGLEDLVALACPSEIQCTAIDLTGNELTFNPQSPTSVMRVSLGFKFSNDTQLGVWRRRARMSRPESVHGRHQHSGKRSPLTRPRPGLPKP